MYAVLGDVEFELITYFDGLDVQFGVDYAEHARIGQKPRLQWVGDKLDEMRIQLVFHASYCDPEQEFLKLLAAMRTREARQFVLGNGTYKGWFVVTELSGTSRQTDGKGALIAMEASTTLRESGERPSELTRISRSRQMAKLRLASSVQQGDLAKPPQLKPQSLPSASGLQQLAAQAQTAAAGLASALRSGLQLPSFAPVIGLVDGAASLLSAASLPQLGSPLRNVATQCSQAASRLGAASRAATALTSAPVQVAAQASQAMGAARTLGQATDRVLAWTQGGTR